MPFSMSSHFRSTPWILSLLLLLVLLKECAAFSFHVSSSIRVVSPTFRSFPCKHYQLKQQQQQQQSQSPFSELAATANREDTTDWQKQQQHHHVAAKDPKHAGSSAGHLPNRAVKIYTDYAKRLWNETNPEARKIMTQHKTAVAVRQVQQILMSNSNDNDNMDNNAISPELKAKMMQLCNEVLMALTQHVTPVSPVTASSVSTTNSSNGSANGSTVVESATKKKRRSVLFGAVMGAIVAGWVFSGVYIFTALFTLMTVVGQLEYYRMVMNTGVYPARRISIVGACSMFLTALFFPNYHQICLPLFGLYTMIWFLTMKRTVTKIPEIATTFTGMFYLGYVPSFWVRIRLLGAGREPTRLASLAGPLLRMLENRAESSLPDWIPRAVHLPITTGAVFIFWTWLCLAFSDVGAYFVGRKYGRTKLGVIAPAAGATSPSKTVEGVLGGCAVSGMLGMLGKSNTLSHLCVLLV
jgi:phosphatidate cytidylyltransferase